MNKRVVFMGTPEIAVPCLQALIDAGIDVPLVVSQPDRRRGRGKQMQATPVKLLAEKLNIPVYQPEKVRGNPEAIQTLKSVNADFFAVVAYGRILPREILDIPKSASINVHFSLLPKYRGAAPVNWAIMNGDEYTGVVTMKMDEGMDTGDILMVEKTPINMRDAIEIAQELSISGAGLLVKTIQNYDIITPIEQPEEGTPAPMMSRDSGNIDWSASADEIERMTRAFVPWPTAHTTLDGKMLKIFQAYVDKSVKGEAGEIIAVNKDSIVVATGGGGLVIQNLQIEGKRAMSTQDFLAGYKLEVGTKVGG